MSANQQKKTQETQPAKAAESNRQETDRTVITFITPWHRYVRGDIAGFSKAEADRLIQKKVAVAGTKLPAAAKEDGGEPAA